MGLYKINKAKLRQFLFFLWVGPPVIKPPQIQLVVCILLGRLWNRVPYFRLQLLRWSIIGLVTVLLSQRQIHYNRKSYKCQLTNCRRYFLFLGWARPSSSPHYYIGFCEISQEVYLHKLKIFFLIIIGHSVKVLFPLSS